MLLGHCHNNSMSKLMKEGIAPIKKLLDTEKAPELFHVFFYLETRDRNCEVDTQPKISNNEVSKILC